MYLDVCTFGFFFLYFRRLAIEFIFCSYPTPHTGLNPVMDLLERCGKRRQNDGRLPQRCTWGGSRGPNVVRGYWRKYAGQPGAEQQKSRVEIRLRIPTSLLAPRSRPPQVPRKLPDSAHLQLSYTMPNPGLDKCVREVTARAIERPKI
jgi:hypothetical protein